LVKYIKRIIFIIFIYLEKLSIHIPWTHLYSQPTKIQLDGFYLLVSPKTGFILFIFTFIQLIKIDINYDLKRAEEEEYQSKMKQVKQVEELRLSIYLFIYF